MKKMCSAAVLVVLVLCSCATPSRRTIDNASGLGAGEILVVGRVVVHPEFTQAEQDLSGAGSDDYRGMLLLLNNSRYKKINTTKTQELTGREWEGRITAKMGDTFYAVFPNNAPMYLLSGAICTKYYWVTVPGTTSWINMGNGMMTMVQNPPTQQLHTKFEYIPLDYKVDINAQDRAIYIGDINIYRDEFNKITKIEVTDNYKKEVTAFKQKFGDIILKKVFVKKAPLADLVPPTEADNFMDSGFRTFVGGAFALAMNGGKGYPALELGTGYQFSRNFTAEISAELMAASDFFSFAQRDFGNNVTLGFMDAPVCLGAKYFIFDGTFSPFAGARLGAAVDMSPDRGMNEFFKIYMFAGLSAGLRWSLDTKFDLLLQAEMMFYNFTPCLLAPKLDLVF